MTTPHTKSAAGLPDYMKRNPVSILVGGEHIFDITTDANAYIAVRSDDKKLSQSLADTIIARYEKLPALEAAAQAAVKAIEQSPFNLPDSIHDAAAQLRAALKGPQ